MKRKLLSLLLALILTLCAVACSPTPPKEEYYFVLYNSRYFTKEDQSSFDTLLKLYPTHDVFALDVKNCEDAAAVYTLLTQEAKQKQGRLDGIQIVGTADAVPSFVIDYKIRLPEDYSTAYKPFFSDYFYANLTQDTEDFSAFNIADFFDGAKEMPMPEHPVVRLPLGSGELSHYLESYDTYITEYQKENPTIVAMSSPIFRYDNRYSSGASADDLAYFLSRAENEWKIAQNVQIYTNRQGDYLSPVSSLGDIGEENLATENAAGVREFFFSGHGDISSLVRTVFTESGSQSGSPYLSFQNISSILDDAPYFMNIHACSAAEGMGENLVREAFRGKCLGAFATTSIISNNGIDSNAPLSDVTSSPNFFGFHYAYLAARFEGAARSDAFFRAQSAFASTLAACAEGELDYASSYEFGYHNLLTYMNFGIFEPTADTFPTREAGGTENAESPIEKGFVYLTNGSAVGDEISLSARSLMNRGVRATINGVSACALDNGCIRFFFEVEAEDAPYVKTHFVSNTNAYYSEILTPYPLLREASVLVIDLPKADVLREGTVALLFECNGEFCMWAIEDLTPLYEMFHE